METLLRSFGDAIRLLLDMDAELLETVGLTSCGSELVVETVTETEMTMK